MIFYEGKFIGGYMEMKKKIKNKEIDINKYKYEWD